MNARTRQRTLKIATFALCLVPLAKVGLDLALSRLGANPIAEVLNRLGFWALTTLLASLTCTPLNVVFGWTAPLLVRKMLGLFAFFYATVHFATYVVVDQGLDFGDILEDLAKRKFITVGFAAWLVLVPLAITSTNGWVRRLGGKRWQALHRLAYVAAGLGVVHEVMRYKVLERLPIVFVAIAVVLGAVRVGRWWRRSRRGRKQGLTPPAGRPSPIRR